MRVAILGVAGAVLIALAGCGGNTLKTTTTAKTATNASAREIAAQKCLQSRAACDNNGIEQCGAGVSSNGACEFARNVALAYKREGAPQSMTVTTNPLICRAVGKGWRCVSKMYDVWVEALSAATATSAGTEPTTPSSEPTTTAAPKPSPPPTPTTPAPTTAPSLTLSQQNAVHSAQDYLQLHGFSRQGLIDQLSSSAGEQYSVQDATVAVDSLHVDWNAQAVRSAKDYLHLHGFSCQGLIDQLDSSAGDRYTEAQAQYGAHAVGLC